MEGERQGGGVTSALAKRLLSEEIQKTLKKALESSEIFFESTTSVLPKRLAFLLKESVKLRIHFDLPGNASLRRTKS